jgi:expansin (peptidoglycan-binding protein)
MSNAGRARRMARGGTGMVAMAAVLATGCGPLPGRIQPGVTYTGEGTFYELGDGNGNCGFTAADEPLYAAMNKADYEDAHICGAFVAVTGPAGNTVQVRIIDQCPECKPGDIDLNPRSFARLADPVRGRIPISWSLVSPAQVPNLAVRVKDKSVKEWVGFQPVDQRNPVHSLEVLGTDGWHDLPRTDYNYFLAQRLDPVLGSGPYTVRITDIYGEQVEAAGIRLSPEEVQRTGVQFAAH